jgi:hypothetical protein
MFWHESEFIGFCGGVDMRDESWMLGDVFYLFAFVINNVFEFP